MCLQTIPDTFPACVLSFAMHTSSDMMVADAESWTACAGLVLSQDAQNTALLGESDTGHTGISLAEVCHNKAETMCPPRKCALLPLQDPINCALRCALCWHPGVQLLLFENYGYLHRPHDSILKAIERVNWIEYNLPLKVLPLHQMHLH